MARVRETMAPAAILNNPRWLTLLFSSTEYSWVWLVARIYLGIQWLESGWHKLFEPAWMETGAAVQGFWQRIVVVPEQGKPAIAYDWYRQFIQLMLDSGSHVWFGKLIAIGETAVGIALLLGLFTGIAAFFGALMNWNFLLAGTTSVNPVLGILGIAVLAAWKVAGWWGLDRAVLPFVGAPWQRGPVLGGDRIVQPGANNSRGKVQWAFIATGGATLGLSLAYMSGWPQVLVGILGIAMMAMSMAVRTRVAAKERAA